MSNYSLTVDLGMSEIGITYGHTASEIARGEWDRYLNSCDFRDDVTSVLYGYSEGYYDGGGSAIITLADGTELCLSLSHCSCYGPLTKQPHTYPDPTSPCAVAARKRAADELYEGVEDE
jgi:hypothetical protein